MNSNTHVELHHLLVSKLIAKYGVQGKSSVRVHVHPANELIQAEVALFMQRHSIVRAGDVAKLERTIRRATQSPGEHRSHKLTKVAQSDGAVKIGTQVKGVNSSSNNEMPTSRDRAIVQGGTSRVSCSSRSLSRGAGRKSGPRPRTVGPVTSCSRDQEHTVRRQSASSLFAARQSKDDESASFIPPNIKNEWLLLETYQQLIMEDKQVEEQRKTREATQRCKQDLENQIRQNLAKAENEKHEAALAKEEHRRLFAEHKSNQALLRDASKLKLLEERRERAHQIMENERRREKERREKQIDDDKTLAACKEKLRQEQEVQLKKRKEIAESLRLMQRENVAKLAEKKHQKVLEAEKDRRLMQEYRERLDREQEERADAHRRRMERYEIIGKQWAEKGAGKRQHDIEVAEEKRFLAEMTRKEKAEEARDERNKETLRRDRSRCLADNRRLMEEKIAQKRKEDEESAKFARQFRSEGEKQAAEDVKKKQVILRQRKSYALKLAEQIREATAVRASVEMTHREREINARILRDLRRDQTLQARISRRLLQQDPVGQGTPSTILSEVEDLLRYCDTIEIDV